MNQLFEEKMDQLLGAVAKDIGTSEIMITLGMAALFAAILWIAYRFAHTRDSYEPKFAVTLIVLSFVSTILMDLIQTNLALSLGMLGFSVYRQISYKHQGPAGYRIYHLEHGNWHCGGYRESSHRPGWICHFGGRDDFDQGKRGENQSDAAHCQRQ